MTESDNSNDQLIAGAADGSEADDQCTRSSLKMHALGRLAGGIAHDFNNMLTTIQGNAELLQMGGFPQEERDDMLAQILDAARRATRMNSQLMKFARKGTFNIRPIDTISILDETAALLAHGIDKRIDIKFDMQADPSIVQADESQLKSALINLGMNACDAMPEGGVLTLRTRNIVLGAESRSSGCDDLADGDYVEICVCGHASGKNGDTPKPAPNSCCDNSDTNEANIRSDIRDLYGNIRIDDRSEKETACRLLLEAAGDAD